MQINTDFFNKTKKYKTPFFIYDLEILKNNYHEIAAAFPNVSIFYAMKCNPHQRFITTLYQEGSGFEIASLAEAEHLIKEGVDSTKIVCFHPIKSPEFLEYLHKHNINVLAADSYEEVDKIAKYAPNSKIVPRVLIDNKDSAWDLSGKFGMPATEIIQLLEYIKSKDLIPYGLTTHVGSQCHNESSWISALDQYKYIWDEMKKKEIHLKLLSLGGGLPVQYRKPIVSISSIGKRIMSHISQLFPSSDDIIITLEPGRGMAATTSILVTSVFGTAKRGNESWLYIETGTYNGLIEAIETEDRQFFPLAVEDNNRPQKKYCIGGPSCVTLDTPFKDVILPELFLGDRLYILNAGAYLSSCAAPFNGFPIPAEYIYNEINII
ncbi:type III PLP-dependent enzyme [soil metagenome]